MSEENSLKTAISEEICNPILNNKIRCNNHNNIYLETPCEVFRNDTTAVEVIVKQVKNKTKKLNGINDKTNIDQLYECIELLTTEVNKAKMNLDEMKNSFKIVMFEMERQLDAANQRELKTHTKNLFLQLEKEKLKTILDSKSNLITKLKKELFSMRRIIKLVSKGIRFVSFSSESASLSDSEYTEFENDLSKDFSKIITSNKDSVNTTNETMLNIT